MKKRIFKIIWIINHGTWSHIGHKWNKHCAACKQRIGWKEKYDMRKV